MGLASADDAAVYQVSDDQALIFTTDFFTPVVDDPYTYGAVAAANASRALDIVSQSRMSTRGARISAILR